MPSAQKMEISLLRVYLYVHPVDEIRWKLLYRLMIKKLIQKIMNNQFSCSRWIYMMQMKNEWKGKRDVSELLDNWWLFIAEGPVW